ncbi:unnamed protein product [Leptosia nina]|uniref:DUF4817 domain-containing protein n=1 Tax=Leptosia nina TaxID=320188 RepID=A0AAV1JWH6_9NEOP
MALWARLRARYSLNSDVSRVRRTFTRSGVARCNVRRWRVRRVNADDATLGFAVSELRAPSAAKRFDKLLSFAQSTLIRYVSI